MRSCCPHGCNRLTVNDLRAHVPTLPRCRVTQNDPIAVAHGCAAAVVLEAVVLGASVAAAVAAAVEWLQQQAGAAGAPRAEAATEMPRTMAAMAAANGPQTGALAEPSVQPVLWAEVADRLLQAAELAQLPPLEAATRLGRNCHLPNSLQTPLHVLLHLEWKQVGGALQLNGMASGSRPAAVQQPGAAAEGAAAGEDACLPCSMGGGTACPLPARRAGQQAAGGSAVLQALMQQQAGRGQPASLPPEAYVEAVRLAIRCAAQRGVAVEVVGMVSTGLKSRLRLLQIAVLALLEPRAPPLPLQAGQAAAAPAEQALPALWQQRSRRLAAVPAARAMWRCRMTGCSACGAGMLLCGWRSSWWR